MGDKEPHSGTCFPSRRRRRRRRGEEEEGELILCGDPKHACIFDKRPREMPNRELTACIHSTSAKSPRGKGVDRNASTGSLQHTCLVFQRFHGRLHQHHCCSLVLISIHSGQGQCRVRCVQITTLKSPRCGAVRRGAVRLRTPREAEDARTWLISSSLCLCCSFSSPNAFPPRKQEEVDRSAARRVGGQAAR